ncbi:hypothetical protein [Litoribacter populi]|uniref:hypothetical protein n=1 Tax=Litoribacter populi TaxID=2598460 RepID=UPI00117EAD6B|nr:hypothetical protein [Litoribacter populi]
MRTLHPLQQKFHNLLRSLLQKSDEEAITEIRNFRDKHEADPYFPQIAKVIAHQEALYLSFTGEHDKSLAIYNSLVEEELKRENPDNYSIGVNYLSILKVLREAGREKEVKALGKEILKKYTFDWGVNLSIFHDLILADSRVDLEPYREKTLEIERELELELDPGMDLDEKLKLLKSENRRANLAYTKIILGNYEQQELIRRLREFADGESVGFYRNLAERNIESKCQ